ncbi:MAG: CapA family protein, partial [Lachnospiraceae bacterium]
ASDATPKDDTVTITISAAGDVTLGNHQEQEYAYSFRQAYDTEGDAYFLKNVKYLFSDDDMTIVNFEGVLTFSEEMQEKDYNMKGDPDYINILTEGSVEAVSFGNNHRLDFKEQGSQDTVEAFKTAGLAYAYDNIVGIYETQGISIGFVSVNEVSQGAFVEKYLQEGIDRLKMEEADLIIACCHWGIERDNYPEDYQKELGRKCIDWGADLVLGSHPHVLQGVDVYEGKFIVYSLANFCFGGNRNPQDKDTMIFRQTFTFKDGEKQDTMEAQVIPCLVSSVSTRNDFCPTPAEGEEYTRILGRINEYSAPFGVEFDENGWYISQ